eukprot:gene21355-25651_t
MIQAHRSKPFAIRRGVKQGGIQYPPLCIHHRGTRQISNSRPTHKRHPQLQPRNTRHQHHLNSNNPTPAPPPFTPAIINLLNTAQDYIYTKISLYADDTAPCTLDEPSRRLFDQKLTLYANATTDVETLYTRAPPKTRYLGYMIGLNGIHNNTHELVQQLEAFFTLWKYRSTTLTNRVTIVKTYLLSKLTFFQFLNTTSQADINTLDNLINWMARRILPMHYGGLGLWDLKARNVAQKAAIFDRFHNQQLSYGQIDSAGESIWNTKPTLISTRTFTQPPTHKDSLSFPTYKQIYTRNTTFKFVAKCLAMVSHGSCPSCLNTETYEHAFFHCHSNNPLIEAWHHTLELRGIPQRETAALIFQAIWRKRNDIKHKHNHTFQPIDSVNNQLQEIINIEFAALNTRCLNLHNRLATYNNPDKAEKQSKLITRQLLNYKSHWNLPFYPTPLHHSLIKYYSPSK